MFYLDLDEIEALSTQLFLVSHNKANVYNFRDDDHFNRDGLGIKQKVLSFLSQHGVDCEGGRIMLLTNLRTFGYIFNPVSFYFCFDKAGSPICVVPEIGNTFGEIKPFFLGPQDFVDGKFISQQKKYFYISPFIDVDIPLDFEISVPAGQLNIKIDDFDKEGKFLYTVMSGPRREITNWHLCLATLKCPFVTLKVIALIHWHAFCLWLKKVPFYEKTSNSHLQKEVYRAWSKSQRRP